MELRLRLHLTPYFGRCRMAQIDTPMVRRYIASRQAEIRVVRKARSKADPNHKGGRVETPAVTRTPSAATINRELEILQRCFRLAVESSLLLHTPHIPMLEEDNVRKGFLETGQLPDVLDHLPEDYRAVVLFAYMTGWRTPSEVLPLEWRQVDFAEGEVRLDVGTTKNREGRVFAMHDDLRRLLLDRRRATDALQTTLGKVIPLVFFRGNGEPIKSFYKAWHTACRAAGMPGRIPHDMCRSSARNMIRRGVAQKTAQQLMGRKTAAIFDRYHIIDTKDLHEGSDRLNGLVDTTEVRPGVRLAAVIGPGARRTG